MSPNARHEYGKFDSGKKGLVICENYANIFIIKKHGITTQREFYRQAGE